MKPTRGLALFLGAILLLASIPATATIWTWSQTAATNSTADATINWAEGQSPGSVNDSARALMAAVAKWRDDVSGVKPSNAILETGGSANAQTLTTNGSSASLTNGFTVTFRVGSGLTNTDAVTLNVDSLGAKDLEGVNGTALGSGVLVAGSVYTATYYQPADTWLLHSFYVGSSGSSSPPTGQVTPYAGSTAPSGWILAYGQAISRTTFSDLFAVIGTTYGIGDGSTTFNVPDLRGRVVAGQDDMGGTSANRLTDQTGGLNGDTLADTGGEEEHTLTAAEVPELTGTTGTDGAHTHGYSDSGTGVDSASSSGHDVANDSSTNRTTDSAGSHNHDVTVNSTGGGAHNNVQPTIILNYIIKTRAPAPAARSLLLAA